jgi:hypothetical protein
MHIKIGKQHRNVCKNLTPWRYWNPGSSVLEADAMTTMYATPPGKVKIHFCSICTIFVPFHQSELFSLAVERGTALASLDKLAIKNVWRI